MYHKRFDQHISYGNYYNYVPFNQGRITYNGHMINSSNKININYFSKKNNTYNNDTNNNINHNMEIHDNDVIHNNIIYDDVIHNDVIHDDALDLCNDNYDNYSESPCETKVKNKCTKLVTIHISNISVDLTINCSKTEDFISIWGTGDTCDMLFVNNKGDLTIKGIGSNIIKNYNVSGTIHIYNKDNGHIYYGIIYGEDGTIKTTMSNRPIIPLGLQFQGNITIQINIKPNR